VRYTVCVACPANIAHARLPCLVSHLVVVASDKLGGEARGGEVQVGVRGKELRIKGAPVRECRERVGGWVV
jgi:hypothetical protein